MAKLHGKKCSNIFTVYEMQYKNKNNNTVPLLNKKLFHEAVIVCDVCGQIVECLYDNACQSCHIQFGLSCRIAI